MTRLILMRHAKSSWDDLSLDDHARPLNKRGRASAKAMGRWLRSRGYVPERVLCSTSERTRQTLALLGLGGRAEFSDTLYHAGPDTMLAQIRAVEGPTVLLIGHNPGIGVFAARILKSKPQHARFSNYPTCATLIADFSAPWSEIEWETGAYVDFAIPREVIASGL